MELGRKIDWDKLKAGQLYVFSPHMGKDYLGIFVKYGDPQKRVVVVQPYMPWLPNPTRMGEARLQAFEYKAVHLPGDTLERKLALVNTKAQFPPELLAELMRYFKPEFGKHPYPGRERQRAATAAAVAKMRAEVPGEEEVAVGRGRKTRRRRRRRLTKRR